MDFEQPRSRYPGTTAKPNPLPEALPEALPEDGQPRRIDRPA
tara:strand:+ start:482 stop:607 length:126 start_codon:yes stop_codon:yes gene_type:complete